MADRNSVRKRFGTHGFGAAVVVAVGVLIVSPTVAFAATWRVVHALPTTLYASAAAVGHNGMVYLFGGGGCAVSPTCPNGISSKATLEYNPTTNTWANRAPMPAPRYYAIAVTGSGGKILVAGGYDDSNSAVNTAWQYTPATNTWKTVASMSAARADAAAALGSDRRIYVFGGDEGDPSNFSPTNTVEAFDPYANTWTSVASSTRKWVFGAAAVAVGSTIYVCGGYVGGTKRFTSEVDAYSVPSNAWSTVAPMPRAESYGGAARARDGKIYVVGGSQFIAGHGYSSVRYVNTYAPPTNTWSAGPSLPQPRDDNAVTSVPGGSLYSIGGVNSNGSGVTVSNIVYALG